MGSTPIRHTSHPSSGITEPVGTERMSDTYDGDVLVLTDEAAEELV